MIAADLATSQDVMQRLPPWPSHPGEEGDICSRLRETVADPRMPGALVPQRDRSGGLWVAAAATPGDWRQLSPVLYAFAGPTMTSFDGVPAPLPLDCDLARASEGIGPMTTAVLCIPDGVSGALRAIQSACEAFARAPKTPHAMLEPTSWLLARFQDHLNVGRWDAASVVLDRLREELRIDALNLKSLQVQLLVAAEDWRGIVELPDFGSLLRARRAPATTAALLEALYRIHLAPSFDDPDEARRLYAARVRPLATALLASPAAATLGQGARRLLGLELLASPSRGDLREALGGHLTDLGWMAERLRRSEPPSPAPTSLADGAVSAVAAAAATQGLDALAAARDALSRLTDEQRQALGRLEPTRSALRTIEAEASASGLPMSWTAWLRRSSDPSFAVALDVARQGAEEWPLGDLSRDPRAVGALVDALDAVQADELARERTFHALPFIVASLRRDDAFPNPVVGPAYANLLTLIALRSGNGGAMFHSSRVLAEALLSIGLDARGYGHLVGDLTEIAGDGFGTDMAFWILELVEAFMRAPTPDATLRDQFVHGALARLSPIRARLSGLQSVAFDRLAIEFGWALEGSRPVDVSEDPLLASLRGRRIGIYSLSESASRQAKAALEGAVEGLRVDCNADHVGTPALRALAVGSDLLIVAWSAAKHAATNFIQAHRGNLPLIYAQGKGVSSLLSAIEEHVRRVARSD